MPAGDTSKEDTMHKHLDRGDIDDAAYTPVPGIPSARSARITIKPGMTAWAGDGQVYVGDGVIEYVVRPTGIRAVPVDGAVRRVRAASIV